MCIRDRFIDISSALMGRFRGGAAKVSIIASALMGMINGSAAANTVTTGAFTIPLMKKSNYEMCIRDRFKGRIDIYQLNFGPLHHLRQSF